MRKIAHLIVLLLFVAVSSANAQERIVVRPTTSNSNGGISEQPDLQRSPVYIPSVFLTDYTLLFEENCIDCQVQILQDETVVYSSFVDEDGIVLLPATLTGECELRLYWGSIVFIGEFNL